MNNNTMKIFLSIIFCIIAGCEVCTQTSPTSPEAMKLSAEVVTLFQQKKYDEALPLAQKVIEIQVRESGKTHLSVGQAWRNLAYLQRRRGKTDEAEKAFENALDIYELNQPLAAADEKLFAELLDVVATYQAYAGKLDKAEKKLQRGLELQEKFYGRDALETSDALLKLAQVYQLKLEYDKASPLFLRALDIKINKLGGTNDETRYVYSNAYCSLTKSGQGEQAVQLREKIYPKELDADARTSKIPRIINGGVINGKALELRKPAYPAEAKAKNVSGTVKVQVTIDETGKVIFACAIDGPKELQRTSEIAAYNSRFSPTTLEGKLVQVTGVVVYNYVR
ncbi:MAG: tetratricopeptide repeat protein [Pyrinomonadaceae bacterium]|nr:tetratricopeptide repeat protein [Pyrinomonadaceae bacterium]